MRWLPAMAGEAVGARHLKVSADFQTKELNIDRMAESFAGLCADAARIGLPVGIEVMPFTNISTVKDGRAVVERSPETPVMTARRSIRWSRVNCTGSSSREARGLA